MFKKVKIWLAPGRARCMMETVDFDFELLWPSLYFPKIPSLVPSNKPTRVMYKVGHTAVGTLQGRPSTCILFWPPAGIEGEPAKAGLNF